MRLWLYFLIAAFFWGGSFVAIKFSLESIPPFTGVFFRVLLAFLFFHILLVVKKRPRQVPKELRWQVWLTGVTSISLPFSLLFWGEQRVSAGFAGIVNGSLPIWAYLLGWVFIRKLERFTPVTAFGALVGMIGIAGIYYPALTIRTSRMEVWAMLAVLGMVLSYAVGLIINRVLLGPRHIDLLSNIYQQLLAATVSLVPLWLWVDGLDGLRGATGLGSFCIVYLGIGSTAIAYLTYYELIRVWGSVRASTVTYVVPIISLFWDWVFFDHHPQLNELVGMILILCSVGLMRSK